MFLWYVSKLLASVGWKLAAQQITEKNKPHQTSSCNLSALLLTGDYIFPFDHGYVIGLLHCAYILRGALCFSLCKVEGNLTKEHKQKKSLLGWPSCAPGALTNLS